MTNDIDKQMPAVFDQMGIKCILVNPRRFAKAYEWCDGNIDELQNALMWDYLDTCDFRNKDIRNYTVLYYKDDILRKEPPSIFVRGDPVCYGPCAIFNKGLESLETEDVNDLLYKRYIYTYDGKTGVCIRLE